MNKHIRLTHKQFHRTDFPNRSKQVAQAQILHDQNDASNEEEHCTSSEISVDADDDEPQITEEQMKETIDYAEICPFFC